MKIEKLTLREMGFIATIFAVLLMAALWMVRASPTPSPVANQIQIDLDKAIAVALPALEENLKAVPFKTSDGKEGWAIRIPRELPLATPAYADGMIFVGGGYGSNEFYAFDAETGGLVWKLETKDDGPTAAVVEDGYVAFNTESCTVIVAQAKTGKVVWQEWLGDPLMSQPAIAKGRLYIAYPSSEGGHRMLCADLMTGRHLWSREITGDVISAPVVSGNQLLFTCFDGTSFCLDSSTGSIKWKKQNAGTSAPLLAGGHVVTTSKEMKDGQVFEGLKRLEIAGGRERDRELLAKEKADYLQANKGGGVALSDPVAKTLDSSVGFSSAPSAAKLNAANNHIGITTVVGAWAYQGSRAAYSDGRLINAQGNYLNSINSSNGRFAWRAKVIGAGVGDDTQVFSPPAVGRRNLYLSSSQGHLASVRQSDGAIGFLYALKQPMAFQPALARGNLYAGTVNGMIICLKTGDKDADGWYAWGGNAQHNKQ
jgi:Ca-activated chloride channel homolog